MAVTQGVFPRDNRGQLIHKQPCQSPGCDHPNWHVCLVGKPNQFTEALENLAAYLIRRRQVNQARALGDGRAARWERVRENTRRRDERIVERYNEGGIGMRDLANEFGVAYQTVRRALQDAGVEIRPRGNTVLNGAK